MCDWQENLIDDEMPPKWMWTVEDELKIWFERVDEKRKEKYGGDKSSTSDDRDAPMMMSNELARGRR